jgi:hypothetical protein
MDEFQFEELVGDNRVESQKDSIRNLGDPEDMMLQIMSILNETVIIPEEGETYTFIYNAKTPNIEYDQTTLGKKYQDNSTSSGKVKYKLCLTSHMPTT